MPFARTLLTVGGTFMIERIPGTVPVEEDGSAHMEAPAFAIPSSFLSMCIRRG